MCICKTERQTELSGGHALRRGEIPAFPCMTSVFFIESLWILGKMDNIMSSIVSVLSSCRDSC